MEEVNGKIQKETVSDIRARVTVQYNRLRQNGCREEAAYLKILEPYLEDTRSSVRSFIKSEQKRIGQLMNEFARLYQMTEFERKYGELSVICGIDEVGRGPLAGPVVACAVILPKDCNILYLNDSKQLTEKKREELYSEITKKAAAVSTGCVPHDVIDKINILRATYLAMKQAVDGLGVRPDLLLVDAVHIPDIPYRQVGIIKGDARSVSIAAASIVAKVTRDHMMNEFDRLYPEYGFASNKGYGSEAHLKALKEFGPCPIHRRSFLKNLDVKQTKDYTGGADIEGEDSCREGTKD